MQMRARGSSDCSSPNAIGAAHTCWLAPPRPLDVAGAGDSLLALFATGLASGQAMMPTAALACCMAALAVETMGNTPISAAALRSGLQEVLIP